MHNAQLGAQMERHRHRRPHTAQFRMIRRFCHDARVRFTERGLELCERLLRFAVIRAEEPFEGIEREVLDRDHGKGARPFARLVPAHAVSHEKQMCALFANLHPWLRQARLPDAHGLGELRDEELVLVARAHPPFVGDAKGGHCSARGDSRVAGLPSSACGASSTVLVRMPRLSQ